MVEREKKVICALNFVLQKGSKNIRKSKLTSAIKLKEAMMSSLSSRRTPKW